MIWGDHWTFKWFWSDHWNQWFLRRPSPWNIFWFLSCYHCFQWFLMVMGHWSNKAMVSMERCGLVRVIALVKTIWQTNRLPRNKLYIWKSLVKLNFSKEHTFDCAMSVSAFSFLWFDQVITLQPICGCGKDQNHSQPASCARKSFLCLETVSISNLEILAEMVAATEEDSSMHLHSSVGQSSLLNPERSNQTLIWGEMQCQIAFLLAPTGELWGDSGPHSCYSRTPRAGCCWLR